MKTEKLIKIIKNLILYFNFMSEKARREGLLALEEEVEELNTEKRNILYTGLQLVVDGTDFEDIKRYFDNILKNTNDPSNYLINKLVMEGVLAIQEGRNPRLLYILLDSIIPLSLRPTILEEDFDNLKPSSLIKQMIFNDKMGKIV